MAKAEKTNPNPNPKPWGVAKAVRHGQGRGGVAKVVKTFPRPWVRGQGRGGAAKDVGRSQGLGCVAKAVRANANPNPKTMDA